jgi:hypothetical protein
MSAASSTKASKPPGMMTQIMYAPSGLLSGHRQRYSTSDPSGQTTRPQPGSPWRRRLGDEQRPISRIGEERPEFADFPSIEEFARIGRFAGISRPFESRDRTTENRGVPGSSPGLAIQQVGCRSMTLSSGADCEVAPRVPDSSMSSTLHMGSCSSSAARASRAVWRSYDHAWGEAIHRLGGEAHAL